LSLYHKLSSRSFVESLARGLKNVDYQYYILPLAGIAIETDLLRAIAESRLRIKIDFSDLKLSLISIFELQAKASKLNVPHGIVSRAVDVILRAFEVIPFYRRNIIEKRMNYVNT